MEHTSILRFDDRILITGAAGFIGPRVVKALLDRGFRNLLCMARLSSDTASLDAAIAHRPSAAHVTVMKGNLLSTADCLAASENAALILHLAAGSSEKSYSDAFLNSVVTTRNLLDACLQHGCLKRFVNVSSLAVYSNAQHSRLLDESCPVETRPQLRGDPYCYAKVRQDELVAEYGKRGVHYVIVRPGSVYGPGKPAIPARVGISTFGRFLHLGGFNTLPLTYVDNCADAIVLAGILPLPSGEVFNILDDNLPSSYRFLRLYKREVKRFPSVHLPHTASFLLSWLWEWYSHWSEGQLPPVFNRGRWRANWKRTQYSNSKLKLTLGWTPQVDTAEGLRRYLDSCRGGGSHA